MIEADERHRDHALVEQVIAELKDGSLTHLPSGNYAATAAWVAHTVIAFNLARATAVAAAMTTVRWATLRTRISNVPARIAATGRRLVLHLLRHWAWAPAGNHCGRPRPTQHSSSQPDHPAGDGTTQDPVEEPAQAGNPATPSRHPHPPRPRNQQSRITLGGSGLSRLRMSLGRGRRCRPCAAARRLRLTPR